MTNDMKRITVFLLVAFFLSGCKGGAALLPNVSGKAGEVVVVMEKADWESELGEATRALLACDCPWLSQLEPLYSLVNITHGGFADLLKIHRNIVFFDINPDLKESKITVLKDIWASPQCVVNVGAPTASEAAAIISGRDGEILVSAIEQAERDRVIANTLQYEEKDLYPQVKEIFGGAPHFPMGYSLKKKTADFVWIADEKQYTNQAVLIYRYEAGDKDEFSKESVVRHRNAILKDNVPGMRDNSYMTTSTGMEPTVTYVKYRGREFAQTRGWWDVYGDYMGGPFVSHSFYSADGRYVIVAEAFVYAPKFDKRQYLRQVESLLFSWE